MKKLISLMLVAVMLLVCLAACGEQPGGSNGGGGESGGSNGGTTVSGAKVGDVLDAPEKTVSLEDIEDLTVTTSLSIPSMGYENQSTYAVSNEDGFARYYEKRVMNYAAEGGTYVIEQLCTVNSSGVAAYAKTQGSGEYYETEFDEVYGSSDGYFRYCLADLGVDYGDWMETEGFEKRANETCQGKDCYVYQVSYTDKTYPEEGKVQAVIWVDKESGLWLKIERALPETNKKAAAIVENVEYTSAIIPGIKPVELKEQVIYDQNDIVITAKGLDCSNPNSVVLRLETKNNSGSDIELSSHYFDVNGLCLGGSVLSYSCAAGETKETELELSDSMLELSAIEIIKNIEFALQIENVHTESSPDGSYTVVDSVLEEKTEPLTIKTECPADYVQQVDKSGDVLIDTDEVYLVLTGIEMDEDGWPTFMAYCENKLSEPIRATINIKTINGKEYDDFEKFSMQENSEGFTAFLIYSSKFQNLGIEKIETIELTYEVYKGESFVGSECVIEESEVISLSFNQ